MKAITSLVSSFVTRTRQDLRDRLANETLMGITKIQGVIDKRLENLN